MVNMIFIDETVGERKVKFISSSITFLFGVFLVTFMIANGEINKETTLALMTGQIKYTGKKNQK